MKLKVKFGSALWTTFEIGKGLAYPFAISSKAAVYGIYAACGKMVCC